MVVYGLSLLPLIWQLKRKFPDIFQPWYANNGAGMARILHLLAFFDRLCSLGLKHGYFPERSKSILIVPQDRVEHAVAVTATHRFKVTTRSRYLGGCISKLLDQTA